MPALLLVLLIALPVVEIFVIVQVVHAIGGGWTVLLLLASAALGIRLLRVRGSRAIRDLRAAVQDGRAPGRELLDGALAVTGAALLVPPGFVTTAAGLLLLLPVTHAVARKLLLVLAVRRWRWLGAGTVVWSPGGRARNGPPPGRETGHDGSGSDRVVEGEVVADGPVADRPAPERPPELDGPDRIDPGDPGSGA